MHRDDQDIPSQVRGIWPGDIIVWHGLVYGDRPPGLILGIWRSTVSEEGEGWYQILTLEGERVLQRAVNLNNEDTGWSRLSERGTT